MKKTTPKGVEFTFEMVDVISSADGKDATAAALQRVSNRLMTMRAIARSKELAAQKTKAPTVQEVLESLDAIGAELAKGKP